MDETLTSSLPKSVFVEVYSNKITGFEYHGLLVGVDFGSLPLDLTLDGDPCIFMHLSHELGSSTCVHVYTLL